MGELTTYNLADLWEAVVDRVPDRTRRQLRRARACTYAELEERANRLAHHLAAQGVGPGDHVGLYLTNGPEYLEAMLAAFKLRAVPINVNYRYVADELRYLFDDADLVAVSCTAPSYADAVGRRARPTSPSHPPRLRWRLDSSPATTRPRSPRRRPSATSARAATTTTTSSTPAAPPACPRAWCGARRTRSSPASAAATRCG